MAGLSLTKLPWKAQLAVFVLLSVAGAGAFYYYYEMPRQEELAKREAELAAVRSRTDRALATARQLPEFKRQVTELQARLETLRPILPDQKDAADLLRRIQTLAAESNLTIRSFRPQPITTRQLHAEWPIALELEGTYHNLGMFLDRVSRFPRIINVSKLVITQNEKTENPNASIKVSCTATTFVLLETPAPAAPAKGAAKPAPTKTE